MLRKFATAAAVVCIAFCAHAAELDSALAAIKAVQREGAGNEQAAARWKELVNAGPEAVTAILQGFDGADPTVANWLRTAIDAICDTELAAGRKLPADRLESFIKETRGDPRARTLALEWLLRVDAGAKKRLLPGMVDDPSAGVRREAIAFAMELGKALGTNSGDDQREYFKKLFSSARDVDQVEAIAKTIKEIGGGEVDVIGHLGLITRWELAGPFDNSGLKGFAAPLPKVEAWKEYATAYPRATVELYQALGKEKGVKNGKKDAVYALARTVIESPTDRPAEIRAASANAIKIYVNGEEVFARDEYHHGDKLDQHRAKVALKAGKNEIILKVLQDAWTYDWTVNWQFQCRVCDSIGGAIPMKVLTSPNAVPMKPVPPKPKKESK